MSCQSRGHAKEHAHAGICDAGGGRNHSCLSAKQSDSRLWRDSDNARLIFSTKNVSLFPGGMTEETPMLPQNQLAAFSIGVALLVAATAAPAETKSVKIVATSAMTSLKGVPVYDEMEESLMAATGLVLIIYVMSNHLPS